MKSWRYCGGYIKWTQWETYPIKEEHIFCTVFLARLGIGFNVLGNTFGSFLLVLAGKYLFQTDTQIRVHFLSPTAFQASARYTLYRIFPESALPLLATYNPENSCSCSGWEDGLIFIQNRGELSIFQIVWIWIWANYWENFGRSIAQKLAA